MKVLFQVTNNHQALPNPTAWRVEFCCKASTPSPSEFFPTSKRFFKFNSLKASYRERFLEMTLTQDSLPVTRWHLLVKKSAVPTAWLLKQWRLMFINSSSLWIISENKGEMQWYNWCNCHPENCPHCQIPTLDASFSRHFSTWNRATNMHYFFHLLLVGGFNPSE